MLTSGVLPLALRALHLVGAILWVGGVAFVGIMALAAATAEIDSQKLARVARIGVLARVTVGMGLAWVAGLLILVPSFGDVYARAGWMHAKLTMILVASALTGVLSGHLRKAANGSVPLSPGELAARLSGSAVLAGWPRWLVVSAPRQTRGR
ncbi:MAG: CopD family protein [Sandaracinaceae bacterium]|nr:CopD family protein [Sandaracinaceae bacterium]